MEGKRDKGGDQILEAMSKKKKKGPEPLMELGAKKRGESRKKNVTKSCSGEKTKQHLTERG